MVYNIKINNNEMKIKVKKLVFNLYCSPMYKIDIKKIGVSLDKKLPSFFSSPNTLVTYSNPP